MRRVFGREYVDSAIVEIDAETAGRSRCGLSWPHTDAEPLVGPGCGLSCAHTWEDEIASLEAVRWREFYQHWLDDLESRLNEKLLDPSCALVRQASQWLISDFVDFYDAYERNIPSSPEALAKVQEIANELRSPTFLSQVFGTSGTVKQKFIQLISTQDTWEKVRPAINMFSVREAVQATLGNGVEPRFGFLGN